MTLTIDPTVFLKSSIARETREFNQNTISQLMETGDMWMVPASKIRQDRKEGKGIFPIEPPEPGAREISIETPAGALSLRHFKPKQGEARGTYLHIHGGGWVLGSADGQDGRLQNIANNCRLHCLSVDYRLAPEHPYPAGPDDCEQAALWLIKGNHGLNTSFLAIGGESAGANLCVVTMLRLRDALGSCPVHAANLTAGVYDLGQTASARNWGTRKLILTTRDMQMFASRYTQGTIDLREPDLSPLFAQLHGLPPALFSVGTQDLLLDDSLLMATRWHAVNSNARLDVSPGGCHVFQSFPELAIARQSNARIDKFLIESSEMSP